MPLHIEATWLPPFAIRSGRRDEPLLWMCDGLSSIPNDPGIYLFGRRFGQNFEPHYVGQATNLQQRVEQQLRTNVPLITALGNAKSGARQVMVCILQPKRGQQFAKALDLMENAVIRAALAAGHPLLNKRGARQPTHEIQFSGNRVGASISGKIVRVPVHGKGG
jgi:hypothetical protein